MPPPLSNQQTSFGARLIRWFGWVLLTLVILLIGGCIAENYRGHHLWRKYRQESEAKGERFDLASIVPSPVPDEQNFAATPFFAPFLDYTIDEHNREQAHQWKDRQRYERHRAMASFPLSTREKKAPDTGHWQLGTLTDLRLWQAYFNGHTNFPFAVTPKDPASDVLTALRRYDAVLNELRAASARPSSVFPVHYHEHFQALLPHLATLKSIAQIVRLRALAQLEAGLPAEALQEAQFALYLADSLKSETFLISSLVRIAMSDISLQVVWEGLARQRWNEDQLTALQSALTRMNILEDYGRAMRTERATSIQFLDELRAGRYHHLNEPSEGDEADSKDYASIRLLPGGVFRQNQLTIARAFEEKILPVIKVAEHRVDVEGVNDAADAFGGGRLRPYRLFADLLLPGVSRAGERFARGQAGIDLALVACALERHRLATGRYPDKLDALTPKFLEKIPPDVITGQPLRYRVTGDGRFLLYSVGWNETDDGGVPGLNQRQKLDTRKGDWVWLYPGLKPAE